MKIACVGAGPGGLVTAILSKQADPDAEVTVYERYPEGRDAGWGLVFWDDLLESLQRNDAPTAEGLAERSFRWSSQVLDRAGEEVASPGWGYSIGRTSLLEMLVGRARELGVLLEFEHPIEAAEQLADADLIVAADGANSALRTARSAEHGTRVVTGRNRYVWLGATKVFRSFTFGYTETPSGWIWFHAYGFNEDTSTFIVECTARTWSGLGLDRLPGPSALALLEELFARQLEGHRLLVGDADVEGLLPWRSFPRVTNDRWHAGKVVLVGDAAHTTHFTIGSGTRLAIEDAIALSASLRAHAPLEESLSAYAAERRAALVPAQAEARLSARWFEDVSRYAGLDADVFFMLLLNRRSALQPYLPPRAFYLLQRATTASSAVRMLRRLSGRAVGVARPRAGRAPRD